MEAIKNGLRKNLTPGTAVERRTLFSAAESESDHLRSGTELLLCAQPLCIWRHHGLSIVLATCFPALSVSTFMWITNAVLDVLGCVFLGIKTMGWDAVFFLHAQLLFQYVRKAVSHVPAFNG